MKFRKHIDSVFVCGDLGILSSFLSVLVPGWVLCHKTSQPTNYCLDHIFTSHMMFAEFYLGLIGVELIFRLITKSQRLVVDLY